MRGSYFKALILRNDRDNLENLGKRYQVAQEVGKKTFNEPFSIFDIMRFAHGFVAIYEFVERTTRPLSEGIGQNMKN